MLLNPHTAFNERLPLISFPITGTFIHAIARTLTLALCV